MAADSCNASAVPGDSDFRRVAWSPVRGRGSGIENAVGFQRNDPGRSRSHPGAAKSIARTETNQAGILGCERSIRIQVRLANSHLQRGGRRGVDEEDGIPGHTNVVANHAMSLAGINIHSRLRGGVRAIACAAE